MSSETMTEAQSAHQTVAAHLKSLEDAYNIGVENGSGGVTYYPQHQEEIWKWEEVLQVLEPASQGVVPILLMREQAEKTLDTMERMLEAVEESRMSMPNLAKHFSQDAEVFALIADQLRAQTPPSTGETP